MCVWEDDVPEGKEEENAKGIFELVGERGV